MKNRTNSKNNNHVQFINGIVVGLFFVVLISFIVILNSNNFYYSIKKDNNIGRLETKKDLDTKYRTIIVHDNTYTGVSIHNSGDAKDLIEKDSTKQKSTCNKDIVKLENKMIKDFNITAVNLCEMDYSFALELYNVLNKIYSDYPNVRGYMTNISLRNSTMENEKVIAAFTPIFEFAKSDSYSTYPWVYKTEILLNSSYFLNENKLASTVNDASLTGHFPAGATIYSPVAHEFGHYLSFVSLLKYYKTNSILLVNSSDSEKIYKITYDYAKGDYSKKILYEAYSKYKNDTKSSIDFNSWRRTISSYAVSRDSDGKYIYDETIAEAFHDTYLNGDNAKDASKYIVDVLKGKLKG